MAIDKTVLTTNIKQVLQPLLKTEYEGSPSVTILHAQIDGSENTGGGPMSSPNHSPDAASGVSYFTVGNTLEQTISGASGIIIDTEGNDADSVNRYQRPIIDIPGRYLFTDTGGKFSGDANTILDGGRVVIRDMGSTTGERTLTHDYYSGDNNGLTFTPGETITQSVTLSHNDPSPVFVAGTTLTGGTSGATGIVESSPAPSASATSIRYISSVRFETGETVTDIEGNTAVLSDKPWWMGTIFAAASGVVLESMTNDESIVTDDGITIFKDLLTGTWDIYNDVNGTSGVTLAADKLSIVSGAWDITEDIIEKDVSKTKTITTLSAAKIHSLTLNPRGILENSTTMAQAIATPVADKVIDLIDEYNLITTGTDTINTTLPSASAYSGRVFKFIKADSGTGKISIDRAGTDTIGINSVTSMELWFQGNYVHLMSDGISKWHVVGTQMFPITTTIITTLNPPTIGSWDDLDLSAVLPAGTSRFTTWIQHQMLGDGTGRGFTLHMRKKGLAVGPDASTELDLIYENPSPANGLTLISQTQKELDCDGARFAEYYIVRVNGGAATVVDVFNVRGYRLG